jgi:hypothetical protein
MSLNLATVNLSALAIKFSTEKAKPNAGTFAAADFQK